jgi:hypothetical protein
LVLPLVAVLSVLLLGLLPTPASAATVEEESPVVELERQAAEIEAELAQAPRSEALLAELTKTRARIAQTTIASGAGDSPGGIAEVKVQLAAVDRAWSSYLKVAKKPSPELAELVAPALFQRAELSKGPKEAERYVRAAARAQRLVTEHRPSKDNWSTLSFYELFAQRYHAAEGEIEKALADTKTAYERKSLEKKFEEVERNARAFGKELKPGK